MELFVLVVMFSIILFVILKPYDLRWSCVFGRHKFHRSGVKHGMYFDKRENKIVGTSRRIYMCRCQKIKKAADEDWIGGIK